MLRRRLSLSLCKTGALLAVADPRYSMPYVLLPNSVPYGPAGPPRVGAPDQVAGLQVTFYPVRAAEEHVPFALDEHTVAPMQEAVGSTTFNAKAVATAASTALPPRRSISVPASAASG